MALVFVTVKAPNGETLRAVAVEADYEFLHSNPEPQRHLLAQAIIETLEEEFDTSDAS